MSKKLLSVLLVAFGFLGLLSTVVLAGLPEEPLQAIDCGKAPTGFTCAAKTGGGYTYDIIAAPSVLNPVTSSDTASDAVIDHIFGTFFNSYSFLGQGAQGTDPAAASVIEVSKDGKTVTYTLRKGLVYSDGSAVTVDDILYWHDKVVYNPNLPNSQTDVLACASDGSPMKVTSPAPNQIQVSCPATYRTFTADAPQMVLSKQMALDLIKSQNIAVDANGFAAAEFLGLGVDTKLLRGLGPYIMTNFNSSAVANYQRNANFYEADSNGTQLPYVDKLTLIIIPTAGQNLSLTNFLNGTTDHYPPRPGDIAPILSQAAAGGFKVNQDINRGNPNSGETLITLNFEDPDPNLAAAARNIKVRQALNLAIDRLSIVQNVLLGLGTPQLNPVSITEGNFFSGRKNTCDAFSKAGLVDAGHPCADGKWTVAQGLALSVTRLPDVTDANVKQQLSCVTNLAGCLDAANKLLDDAGLTNKDKAGVRQIPAGYDKVVNNPGGPFNVQIVTNTGNTIREESEKIACDGWNKIGVQCTATTTAFPTLVDQLLKGTFTGAILIGLTGGDPDGAVNVIPCGTPLHLWHVACDPAATSGPQAATDDEKALTDAFNKGHAATDVPGAQVGFDAEQAAWANFVPYMHTSVQNGLWAERIDRISNTGRAATGNDDLKFRCDLKDQKPACADAPHG
jgi:ABC-type transport system substrate-binding protein